MAEGRRRLTAREQVLTGHVLAGVDRALDIAGQLADRNPKLARWRQDRFLERVSERLSIVGVDGPGGTRYLVNPRDRYIGHSIIHDGAFELARLLVALRILDREESEIERLLDVGANIGTARGDPRAATRPACRRL